MFRTITTGIATTLLGLVFLLGGPTIVSADPASDSAGGASQPAQTAPVVTTGQDASGTLTADQIAENAGVSTLGFLLDSWVSCDGFGSCLLSAITAGPSILFYIAYKIASILFLLSGMLFDYSLFLSIDNNFVSQPFIDTLWTTVRDFSNMIFIFILIYTGINTMLFGANWQKTVLHVVIIALLINFSLFFTKVIIDTGNILALGVYDAMDQSTSPGQKKELSGAIVEALQPQRFTAMASAEGAQSAIIVFAIAIIINLAMAWVFFTTALIFIGRLMAFWFLMIISPFAFISAVLPKGNILSWWIHTLLSQSFLAPVFLFAMYIILQIVNDKSGVLSIISSKSNISGHGMVSDNLIAPVLIATLLVVAIMKAKSLAEKMSEDFGGLGSKVVGGMLGLAAGGTALAGQKLIGRAALKATEKTGFKEWAAKSPIGRVAYNLTDKTANAAFDARNLPGASHLGLGKGQGGSIVKTIKEAKEADIEFGKKITVGKDGKPIKGAAEAYAEQLEAGYITRLGTGGNIGAEKAAKEIRDKNKKLEKLEKQKAEKLKDLRNQLGIDENVDLESDEVINKKKKRSEELDLALAKAEVELEQVKRQSPGNIEEQTNAIIAKKKAERDHKKFENAQAEIDKIQKEIKEIGDGGKKEEKKEKNEDKH